MPWYAWYDTPNKTWQQGYYDDSQSLDLKYRLVNTNGLAGIGIWTLLMDAGTDDLWNVIDDRFVKAAERLGGADRYATAAAVSQRFFSTNVPVAFIATGGNFPDALTAGPAAAKLGGPLLLVRRDTVPDATVTELQRLRPQQIVILGGTGVVNGDVAAKLAAFTSGSVRRIAGADRFQTAAAVSAAYFSPGVSTAFVATGLAYPDALAGVSYAASVGAPILLTMPTKLPASTAAELTRLRPGRIIVLGGTAAVSDGVATALRRLHEQWRDAPVGRRPLPDGGGHQRSGLRFRCPDVRLHRHRLQLPRWPGGCSRSRCAKGAVAACPARLAARGRCRRARAAERVAHVPARHGWCDLVVRHGPGPRALGLVQYRWALRG